MIDAIAFRFLPKMTTTDFEGYINHFNIIEYLQSCTETALYEVAKSGGGNGGSDGSSGVTYMWTSLDDDDWDCLPSSSQYRCRSKSSGSLFQIIYVMMKWRTAGIKQLQSTEHVQPLLGKLLYGLLKIKHGHSKCKCKCKCR